MKPSTPKSASAQAESLLDAVLADYLRQRDAGQSVNQEALVKKHPDLKDGLRSWFAGEAIMEAAMRRSVAPTNNAARMVSDAMRETVQPGGNASDTASEFSAHGFGRYELLRPLGEGAMGNVYLALDTMLGRQVALKVPKVAGAGNSESLARFAGEARAAAGLRHENICSVYDAGEHDGTPYMTMDFIDGDPLSGLIGASGFRSVNAILTLIAQIADAVGHAHENGVVHRDLKPANILIDSERKPYVTDFGLARRMGADAEPRITQEGLLIGTPAYMAPEQIKGEQAKVGPQSDIYSLGVILFELLTERLPFEGPLPTIVVQCLRDAPPAPSAIRPDLSRDIDALCLRMLKKAPDDRYSSMAEVIAAAKRIRRSLRIAHTPQTAVHPGRTRKSTLLGRGLIGVAMLLAAFALTIIYLKTGNQTLAIHVDQEWFRRQGGPLTLLVDGHQHTISTSSGAKDPVSVTVTLGKHRFSVSHGDVVVNDPQSFNITRDGKRILYITANDIRLVDGIPPAKPADAAEIAHSVVPGRPINPDQLRAGDAAAGVDFGTEPSYAEIHGATETELLQWAENLSDGLRPSWISEQSHSVPPRWHAIATESDQDVDWKLMFISWNDQPTWRRMNQDHVILFHNVCLSEDHRRNLVLYVPRRGKGREIHYSEGNLATTRERLEKGMTAERRFNGDDECRLPIAVHGCIATKAENQPLRFDVIQDWQPRRDCEWHLDLSFQELVSTIADYGARGWRPHIVNSINQSSPPRYFAVFLNNPNHEQWAFSPSLNSDEYRQCLSRLGATSGKPRCVFSRVIEGDLMYSVVWDEVAESEVPVIQRHGRPLPMDDTELNQQLTLISQVHGATAGQLQAWAESLPQRYRPSWISLRAAGPDIRFDAIAQEAPVKASWKLDMFDANDAVHYEEMAQQYRPAIVNIYEEQGAIRKQILWADDDPAWNYWIGDAAFITEKIENGFRNVKADAPSPKYFMPTNLSAVYYDGRPSYELCQAYGPNSEGEFFSELTIDEITAKLLPYSRKRWRLHLLAGIQNAPESKFAAVFVHSTRESRPWAVSSRLSVNQYEDLLLQVDVLGGWPRSVASTIEDENVVYRVLWEGILQRQLRSIPLESD